MEMWAIVDEKGSVAKIFSEVNWKDMYLIFGTEKEAKDELKDILDDCIEELETLKEEADADGCNVEDYEDYDMAVKFKKYFEKCKVRKIKVEINEEVE